MPILLLSTVFVEQLIVIIIIIITTIMETCKRSTSYQNTLTAQGEYKQWK